MYTLDTLNIFTVEGYGSMTFPSFRPLLRALYPQGQVVAIGASWCGQPVGLALARMLPGGNSEVLSMFVAAPHRGRGVGTALLTSLEQALSERGSVGGELVYMTGKPSTGALERLLRKCGWPPSRTRMLVCKGDKKILEAPWMREYRLPSSFSIFPWREITEEERAALRRSQERERWIPEYLAPFQHEQTMERLNSLGLRYGNQVVGWLITHRVAPDTVRFTSLFVRKDLQKMGRAVPLVVEAINRQGRELGHDSYVIFSVRSDNTPMMRFTKRHFAPYLASMTETRGTSKLFDKGGREKTVFGVGQKVGPCVERIASEPPRPATL